MVIDGKSWVTNAYPSSGRLTIAWPPWNVRSSATNVTTGTMILATRPTCRFVVLGGPVRSVTSAGAALLTLGGGELGKLVGGLPDGRVPSPFAAASASVASGAAAAWVCSSLTRVCAVWLACSAACTRAAAARSALSLSVFAAGYATSCFHNALRLVVIALRRVAGAPRR